MIQLQSKCQFIADTEDKELLDKERKNLNGLISECKELKSLLHIKKLLETDIDVLKNEYVRQHCNLSKEELLCQLTYFEDIIDFIKNYK